MGEIAIRVEHIWKGYLICTPQPHYRTLRESLTEAAASPFRRLRGSPQAVRSPQSDHMWALHDVSFEVTHGEVLGIIGRNGAGKSTLLKILSRITKPTRGRAEIHGRVGSLLEVGTGFHPELTGRENIYLNGAILGMRKAEIEQRFDEIVAFAEIARFIDTPVKRYSSGMYVRLAFAVAAHLEPEILLVDEVLAVGDAAFQRKCLGKMGDVARAGRTVLLVSHNMAAISRLCSRGIWLDQGRIQILGPAQGVVEAYMSAGGRWEGERRWEDPESAPGNEKIRLRAVRVVNPRGEASGTIDSQQPFTVEIEYEVLHGLAGARVGFFLLTAEGVVLFAPNDAEDAGCEATVREPGRYVSACTVPKALLNSGMYAITASADIPGIESLFYEEAAIRFHVERLAGPYSSRPDRLPGVICPPLAWRILPVAGPCQGKHDDASLIGP